MTRGIAESGITEWDKVAVHAMGQGVQQRKTHSCGGEVGHALYRQGVCTKHSLPPTCMDAGVYDKYMTCMWWACVAAYASVFMLVLVRVACLCMVGLGHDSGGMCDHVVMIACMQGNEAAGKLLAQLPLVIPSPP
eukprot:365661-Chlamydomonas_euryale.AAC.2